MYFPPSELVLDAQGRVYHLGITPSELADTVLLVGDQDRVPLISAFFDTVEHRSQHREFVCHTGNFQGKRISVISTGIGTDNIDIVLNELDALVNIDLEKREVKTTKTSLDLIRIGTCGILQPEIPLHSYIVSSHAVGLDNVAHFYPISFSREESEIASEFHRHLQLPPEIIPYCTAASEALTKRLQTEHTFSGITVTASGFYGPQGRKLRLGVRSERLNERLTAFRSDTNHRVVNFEMESSALFALGKAFGHRCATICLGVANRPLNEFSKGCEQEMNELILFVLHSVSQ